MSDYLSFDMSNNNLSFDMSVNTIEAFNGNVIDSHINQTKMRALLREVPPLILIDAMIDLID